jgi:serine/threonine protein kinase
VSDDSVTVSEHLGGPTQTWGSLQILEELGRGGFGVVHRAWEPALAREVALKIIRPRDPNPDALASILREGQLLARVRHPNVVAVHGAQQIGDEVGLWMELVRGRSLSRLVREDGPRAAGEAAVIGISVCQALAAVHQAGVLHRDIKAQNVMREAGGRIVLMDFGAGQALEGPRHPDERAIGTPAYMAPEVLAGGRASARSDIYSLGVLLYYLVTGTYPVDGHSWSDFLLAHARYERRPLGDVRPDIDASFVRVVERATALNPDDRYASPGAMLVDLTAAATGRISSGPRRAHKTDSRRRKAPEPPRPVPKNPWKAVAAAAAPLLAIGILGTITSVSFNHTLGRPSEYTGESVLSWWVWGARALLPGAVYSTIVVLIGMMIRAIWKLLTRISGPIARTGQTLTARRHALAARLGLDDPDMAAQALLAAQVVAVAAFCWYFRDIFSASLSFIADAAPEDLDPLRPDRAGRHQGYLFAMSMLILAMSIGLYQILKLRRRTPGATPTSVFLVAGVIGVSFIILVFPYRLMWQNEAEGATYGQDRCYILGRAERSTGVMVYCPDTSAPKTREVKPDDPRLQPSGVLESIYSR